MSAISKLRHIAVPLPFGGKVVVLDPGAIINPEAEAMLQALHSRSIGGISAHLDILANRGPEKFMQMYYVGYGHKSIGDCGTVTLFIEGVSMLVAKAIQDWPLYSGQEASTRYIDFSQQPFIDPVGSEESEALLEDLRRLYLYVRKKLVPVLVRQFPRQAGEKESVYEKAINARSFDIARSLLPAGAATNLAWHSNLRQIADKLLLLRFHPLREVRIVAHAIEEAVCEAFSSSFDETRRYRETEVYNKYLMRNEYLFRDPECPEFEMANDSIDRNLLEEYREALQRRPNRETELPWFIEECGTLRFRFLLDYGSFRDIQRHRAVIQRMPLVTTQHGFEPWYFDQMNHALHKKVERFVTQIEDRIRKLDVSPEVAQYYTPMGFRLPNRLAGGLHGLVYLAERRARSDVHPTLQIRAHQAAGELNERFGSYGLTVHTDPDMGRFDLKRGTQDIVVREV